MESVRLELSLAIAEDAHRASLQFWKTWLWQSRETAAGPSESVCASLAARYDIPLPDVQRQWLGWYVVLTSFDLASALAGYDVRATTPSYGASHRRV